jgi:hypothetical protein
VSYSTLYVIHPDGKVHDHKEYRNGWGYAMPVWTYLAEKYLGQPDDKEGDLTTRWWVRGQGKPVFDLKGDPRLERWERIALMASFDHVIVMREHAKELIDAFRKLDETLREKHPKHVTHYSTMARDIEVLLEDSKTTGVCWNATSVSETHWWVHDECTCTCGDMHVKQEGRCYDISKDKNHWSLFEELEDAAKVKP